MPTALDLITRSYRLFGYLDPIETPEAEDANQGLETLNELVEHLGTMRQTVYIVERSAHPLSASTQSYTIGAGGVFNIARPQNIEYWSITPDRAATPVYELPFRRPLTVEEWQRIPVKGTTGSYPTDIYYDHGWTAGLGTIQVYPIPTTSNPDLILYTPTALAAFADLTTNYTFPRGYLRMLRYQLAVELAEEKGRPITDKLEKKATEALAAVKRANFRPKPMQFDAAIAGVGRPFNI